MAKERCPYCHEYIESSEMMVHDAAHRKLQADGQQTVYVTLPEEDREQGDLGDEPTVYIHRKCGEATQMPEDIVRSYDLSAASYITKPGTFDALVEVVRSLGRYWLEIVELAPESDAP